MKLKSFDFETTTKEANNYGHPFDSRNREVLLCCYNGERYSDIWADQADSGGAAYGEEFDDDSILYCAFNAKFDLHWLRRVSGRKLPLGRVWCCQVAEMVLTRQLFKMPSLNSACARYGLGQKKDVVKSEYWDKGIDTDLIPKPILLEYGREDARLTYELAVLQIEEAIERGLYNTIRMSCCDLIILADMEWNGMVYDVEKSKELAIETSNRIAILDEQLREMVGDTEGVVSFDSPQHLSAVLFGGPVKYKKPYVHVFKNGNSKIRHSVELMEFPQLLKPPKQAKLPSSDIYYSTSTTILSLLTRQKMSKFTRLLLDKLVERSKLEQLRGTYYVGIPKLFDKFNWKAETIHHSLNQTVAITGRLSSSNPNLQNQSEESKLCFVSRFQE
jgi:DNA polymerase I - 3''-5'' exonuclease and polymerase domains